DVQPSKKMMLLILSGVVSFAFCLLVFFVIYFFDKSVNYPSQLANESGIPVIGYINRVSEVPDFYGNHAGGNKSKEILRNLIRSIRYELDSEKAGPKLISVTSLGDGESKTLLIQGLAWAFAKVNQRVLLIDGNFTTPDITQINGTKNFVEDLFLDKNSALAAVGANGLAIIGNKGGDVSLNELADIALAEEVFSYLLSRFDVILVETDSLKSMNKAKEWIAYSDVVVSVFKSGKTIDMADKAKIEYLKSLGGKFAGWVFTQADGGYDTGTTH
ncbi:MAG TPA: lipopolysaccharide biosynthesis protein, partial [Dyadobacter sp.]|nr:lipopolysaccharide biosynthesis protein [Dyadobacter sp.]